MPVQVLLEAGAQATSPLNALALACCMDDPAAATAALDQGADPNTPCHGCTPLAMATATNSLRTAEVLLDRGADPSAASRLHCPPALLYHRTVGAQLEAPAPPLVLALLQGAPQMARLLAQRGADRTVTWKGVMPLGHVLGLMRDSQELKLLDTAAKEQLEQQIEQQKIKMKQYALMPPPPLCNLMQPGPPTPSLGCVRAEEAHRSVLEGACDTGGAPPALCEKSAVFHHQ